MYDFRLKNLLALMAAMASVAFAAGADGAAVVNSARTVVMNEANNLRTVGDTNGYRVPAFPWSWNWGSNSAMANNGIVLMHAYYLTKFRCDWCETCQEIILRRLQLGCRKSQVRKSLQRVCRGNTACHPREGVDLAKIAFPRSSTLQNVYKILYFFS